MSTLGAFGAHFGPFLTFLTLFTTFDPFFNFLRISIDFGNFLLAFRLFSYFGPFLLIFEAFCLPSGSSRPILAISLDFWLFLLRSGLFQTYFGPFLSISGVKSVKLALNWSKISQKGLQGSTKGQKPLKKKQKR